MQQEPRPNHTETSAAGPIVFFGTFSLNLQTGELCKAGVRVQLQNKPFQLLKALLGQPGRVVTREELRAHVWAADTFVDFESGLNTAVNRLRLALRDSADSPRYVETLPKVGYRFIAPVTHSAERGSNSVDGNKTVELAPIPLLPASVEAPSVSHRVPRIRWAPAAIAVALLGLGVGVGSVGFRLFRAPATPVFRQLTFRTGNVDNARFTSSGEVVYSAQWTGQKGGTYLMDPGSPESRELGLGSSSIAAVSKSSDVALLRRLSDDRGEELLVSTLLGGSPRSVATRIAGVDWGPDRDTLCLMRLRVGDWVIEYPAGRALYHGPGWPGPARVSPNGDLIAFIEHPILDDDAGFVMTVDRHGHARKLTDEWASLSGLAWNPGGTEIWFTAAKQGVNRDVYAVSMKRNLRRIASMPAPLRLFDISSSGRVLLGRSVAHMSMFIGDMQSQAATETSWLDWSHVVAVSADGQSVLFDESGEGGGPLYTAYVYRRDRNTAERIGSGRAMDISEDGQSILTGSHLDPSTLKLLTLAKTEERTIRAPGLTYQSAKFVPRSHDIVVQATDECEPMRTYLQNVDTGKLHRLATADGMSSITPSPDGKQIAGSISPKEIGLVNLVTGERTVIVAEESSMPVEWSSDDELVLQVHRGTGPVVLQKLNIRNRRATKIKEIPQQGELASAESCKFVVRVSRNLKTFAYSQLHIATGLFAVDGWS